MAACFNSFLPLWLQHGIPALDKRKRAEQRLRARPAAPRSMWRRAPVKGLPLPPLSQASNQMSSLSGWSNHSIPGSGPMAWDSVLWEDAPWSCLEGQSTILWCLTHLATLTMLGLYFSMLLSSALMVLPVPTTSFAKSRKFDKAICTYTNARQRNTLYTCGAIPY